MCVLCRCVCVCQSIFRWFKRRSMNDGLTRYFNGVYVCHLPYVSVYIYIYINCDGNPLHLRTAPSPSSSSDSWSNKHRTMYIIDLTYILHKHPFLLFFPFPPYAKNACIFYKHHTTPPPPFPTNSPTHQRPPSPQRAGAHRRGFRPGDPRPLLSAAAAAAVVVATTTPPPWLW